MASPKRKTPVKKATKNRKGILLTSANLVAAAFSRHPATLAGTMGFAVVFSLVASNALWYQPGKHPHPLLNTRDAFRAFIKKQPIAAVAVDTKPGVTTFKIERQAAAPAQKPAAPKKARKKTNVVVLDNEANTGTAPIIEPNDKTSNLVQQIQSNLVKRGLYDGPVDGLMGPKTAAAISFYEETRGLPETGKPGRAVLSALKQDNAEFSIIPAERPEPDITGAISNSQAADPVSALIKSAKTNHKPATALPQKMIAKIQQGLVKMSYKDVDVDGFDGPKTRAAIRHFQKHYRLTVNGESSKTVLKKLQDIGAI